MIFDHYYLKKQKMLKIEELEAWEKDRKELAVIVQQLKDSKKAWEDEKQARRRQKRLDFARKVGRVRLDLELLRGSTALYDCDTKQIGDLFADAADCLTTIRKHINTLLNKDKGGDGDE